MTGKRAISLKRDILVIVWIDVVVRAYTFIKVLSSYSVTTPTFLFEVVPIALKNTRMKNHRQYCQESVKRTQANRVQLTGHD